MQVDPPPFSAPRFRHAWKLFKSRRAEGRKDFESALGFLDEAGQAMPLRASDRVHRADLLMKAQRTREAQAEFLALRDEFKGSDEPDIRYLRHYCTAMVSMFVPSSGQWAYEAKQGKLIECSPSIKRRFPMVTVDEIYKGIRPRR